MILGKWQSKNVTVKQQNVMYKFRLCLGLIVPPLLLIRPPSLTINREATEFMEIPDIPDTDTDDLLRMASTVARANVPEGVKHESDGRTLRGCCSVCWSRTTFRGVSEGMFCPTSEPLAPELNLQYETRSHSNIALKMTYSYLSRYNLNLFPNRCSL